MLYLHKVSRLKNSSSQLEELKRLLLEPELEQLKKLSLELEKIDLRLGDQEEIVKRVTPLLDRILLQNLENKDSRTVKILSEYLSTVIEDASRDHLPELTASLQAVIAPAISKEIANNQEVMIDALYPIMGGMISKYVTQAIKELMEHINKKIEQGLSVERFKRKIKAKLSGVSETELLLEESSDVIISEMFVIHKESGLLISSASLENHEIDDPHMVASMASAIKDFINDWIQQHSDSREEVQILSYGNATLYIESAGSVYMIAFLNNEPDYELRSEINAFFASLVKEYASFFQSFDGDDSAKEIKKLSEKMKKYLRKQEVWDHPQVQKNKKNPAKYIFLLIAGILLAYGIYMGKEWYMLKKIENNILQQTLQDISISKADDKLVLTGYVERPDMVPQIEKIVKHATGRQIVNHIYITASGLKQLLLTQDKQFNQLLKPVEKKVSNISRTLVGTVDTFKKELSKISTLDQSEENSIAIEKLKKKMAYTEEKEKKIYRILHIKETIADKLFHVLGDDASYKKEKQVLDFAALNLFAAGEVTYNTHTIKTAAASFIKYIDVLMAYKPYIAKIVIEGHSDSSGDSRENLIITEERAAVTKKYFLSLPAIQKYHIDTLLHIEGKGDSEPVLLNGIEDKNMSRRISIRFELNSDAIVNAIDKVLND